MEFLVKTLRHHKIFVKFIIAGGIATLVDFSLLFVFTDIFKIWYVLSASLAFMFAFVISFHLQKFWTFRDGSRHKIYKQVFIYFLVTFSSLIINAIGMYILVEYFNIWYMLAQVIIGGFLAGGNFFIYK